MRTIEQIGNTELLKRKKTLFLCSKRTPVEMYGQVFQWVDGLSERECIVCFNSTEMEVEVMRALLVNEVPTILVVMNKFRDKNNIQIERALKEKRMLILVLKRDESKGKGSTPRLRNEFVISKCDAIVCGYVNKNGTVFGLLAGRSNVDYLIKENPPLMAAETDNHSCRWTVGEDKTLLRMFYEDMGIHAIHKQLHRSYLAIYTRIRSITLPEDVLKGREFEDYVLELFDVREGGDFTLKEWQGDKILGDVCPESNRHPDFVFSYQQSHCFAVECKWRERLTANIEKDLFSTDKLAIYQQFSDERLMPVSVVLGVGGEPCQPELLYIIPLSEISSVMSHTKSIVEFLRPSTETPFCITDFIPIDDSKQQKAYTIVEKRAKNPNAYRPWTIEYDERLLQLSASGKSITELCEIFGRNHGAITSRLRKLTSC